MKLTNALNLNPSLLLLLLCASHLSRPARAATTLQILHSSDNESSFQDPNTLEEKVLFYSALTSGLKQLATNEGIPSMHATVGDHTLPGPFFQASAEVDEFGNQNGIGDIEIYNAFPLNANGMGNHEFDDGIDTFAFMLANANYPFLAVNLDFSAVTLADGTPPIVIGADAGPCADIAGQVAKSCYVTLEPGGVQVGLIGRAPAEFFNVIEDPVTTLPGLDFVGGRDNMTNLALESAVPQVLEQVDLLEAQGISIIVLLDHAQDFTSDPLSASSLRGVDIIAAAGATGFYAGIEDGPFNFLREGETGTAPYPVERTDSQDKKVLVINSDQLYRYIGQLLVTFNDSGEVESWDTRSGPIATTAAAVELLAEELNVGTLEADPVVAATLALLQATPSITNDFEAVATTAVPLNGLRADIRTRSTNLGDVVADSTLWGGNAYASDNDLPTIDIGYKNGGGIRDSITGPTIVRLTIGAALAFDNKLSLIELTAAQLIAAVENGVSRVQFADGRFPHIAGMTMEYDPTKPGVEGMASLNTPSRVKNLIVSKFDGSMDTVIADFVAQGDLSRIFTMATNSFLLTGGDGYVSFSAANTLGETDIGEQLIFENYIVDELGGEVDVEDPPLSPRVSVSYVAAIIGIVVGCCCCCFLLLANYASFFLTLFVCSYSFQWANGFSQLYPFAAAYFCTVISEL
jgi:2',3'-cyclic-nucleotide 2'-phosphodiesterase (5'-nucleotidase family)